MARHSSKELSKDQKGLHFGKDGFQACVDVHHFAPSEVTVKTVDNQIIVEGKHEASITQFSIIKILRLIEMIN